LAEAQPLTSDNTVLPVTAGGDGRKVAIGAMSVGAVNIIKAVIQLLLLPVMARLLGPQEFGLYALALPTVSLVTLLADGGLGSTLAREREDAVLIWSSAFWALLMMGIVLALGATSIGMLLGNLTGQPRLPGLIGLLSVSLVFLTLSVVPSARLTRRKRLVVGAGAELSATLAGAAVGIAMAWRGAGAWSLAAQYLTTYAVRATVLNFAAFHLPRAEFSMVALWPHFMSGGIFIGSRISEYAGRMTENLLVDRIFGTALLGDYTFANQISKFATDAAANVVWAALYVQALTEDKERIVVLHRSLCRLLGIALFPTMFLAAAAAPELVNLLLGPAWTDLSFFLRVFLPLSSVSVICSQSAPILLAYGRFDIYFYCMFSLSLARVVAVFLGFWIGPIGSVYCIVVVTLFYCVTMLVAPAKITGCKPLPVIAGLIRPAIAGVVAAGVCLMVLDAIPPTGINTFIGLAIGSVAFVLSMFLIDRKHLGEDKIALLKMLAPKRFA
jgi:O-antigen/teichoic acid export membrane protein